MLLIPEMAAAPVIGPEVIPGLMHDTIIGLRFLLAVLASTRVVSLNMTAGARSP